MDERLEKQKDLKESRELEGCTFKPIVNRRMPSNTKDRQVYQEMALKNGTLYADLSKKLQKQKEALEAAQLPDKDLVECTFKPKTNKRTKQENRQADYNRQENQSMPKGYEQVVQRMRGFNQQKEAQTKQIEDKCTGSNYEKTRS